MKKTRKTIALIIALLMCLTLAVACGNGGNDTSSAPPSSSGDSSAPASSSNNAPPPSSPGPSSVLPTPSVSENTQVTAPPEEAKKFVEHLEVSIDNNPVAAVNAFSTGGGQPAAMWTYNMIYNTLMYDDERGTGEYYPELATKYETTDWKTFTFWLRDDVTFHNGEHFSAKDVEYTINLAHSDDAVGSGAATNWIDVESVKVIDDYTIEMTLNDVNVDFLGKVCNYFSGIVNEKAITADPVNGTWIGTGPFYISGFSTMDYIEVTRNDNYWGDPPYTKIITLRFIPEMSARTIMLQNGEIQLALALNPEDLIIFANDTEHFEIFPNRYNNPNTIGFNMEDPITGDVNFRKACISAIDMEEVAIVAAGDMGEAHTEGVCWGYYSEFRKTDIPAIPYDLDKAREYLAASNYNGEEVEIATAIVTMVRASEVIQQQLNRIGINTRINQMDPASLSAYAQWDTNKSQIIVFLAGTGLRASGARSVYYPGVSQNRSKYNNPRVNEILDTAPTVTDYEARKALYYEMQDIIAEDVPIYNMFWLLNWNVGVKGLGGLEITPSGLMNLTYVYLPEN